MGRRWLADIGGKVGPIFQKCDSHRTGPLVIPEQLHPGALACSGAACSTAGQCTWVEEAAPGWPKGQSFLLSYSEKLAAYFLLFLLMTYSTAGFRSPLIMLQHYEGSGIKLTCKTQVEESPELFQISWMDSKGQELASAPVVHNSTNLDILLEPGAGNALSCRIIKKSSNLVLGSTSLVIEDIFFPATSGFMVAFFLIAILSILIIIGTIYKLKRDKLKIAQAVNEKDALQDEILQLKKCSR
ncbi:uncharacterized protein LOC132712405 [Pantherophis guttatus]|uniref:Uncharacterized protein LOC132712405 n=1 Tax=Pantherophis guttatus TaxID=94885 RepID=A0ABM3ZMR9_PANGU|nr:uncharacterized protein LOC132712405 [Pantherophis guttatus]